MMRPGVLLANIASMSPLNSLTFQRRTESGSQATSNAGALGRLRFRSRFSLRKGGNAEIRVLKENETLRVN